MDTYRDVSQSRSEGGVNSRAPLTTTSPPTQIPEWRESSARLEELTAEVHIFLPATFKCCGDTGHVSPVTGCGKPWCIPE